VILSHNLTALVVAASALGVSAAIYAPVHERMQIGARILAGLALGIGIAAWFWWPALATLAWVRPEELLRGKFEFAQQWQSAAQLFGYARFFSAGAGVPLALLAGAVAALRMHASRERSLLIAALAGAAGCVLLMHPSSTPLWRSVRSLALFQFPWRFVGPLSLYAALAGALAYARLTAHWSIERRRVCEIALCVLGVLNALPQLARSLGAEPYSSQELTRVLRPESVRTLGLGLTVYDEYLPRSAERSIWRTLRPLQGPVIDTRPSAAVEIEHDRGTRIALHVTAAKPTRIRLARWAFPGWQARWAGSEIPLLPSPTGVVELELAPASGVLELELHPPRVRSFGLALSAASLLVLCAAIFTLPRATGVESRA
jgi:hypothetical protein